mgnify:CR=1 FL=1|tara:strand:- start:44247 stop:44810 length:564 start_codon:yes stop_codon:yes gene_type:complete
MKYNYVFGIKLNHKAKDQINKILKKLKNKVKVSYISSKSSGPHITLTNIFKIKNEKKMLKVFEEVKKINNKSFKLKFKNISIFFGDTPSHVIRWEHNEEIILLKRKIENILKKLESIKTIKKFKENINFIAKSTIAYKDTNYNNLVPILKTINKSKIPNYCIVDNICLYGFIPYVKEEEIFKIKLKK